MECYQLGRHHIIHSYLCQRSSQRQGTLGPECHIRQDALTIGLWSSEYPETYVVSGPGPDSAALSWLGRAYDKRLRE